MLSPPCRDRLGGRARPRLLSNPEDAQLVLSAGAKLLLGLGGSIDVYAGEVRRATGWMIRCSLEWFDRLLQEPSRLGRMLRLPKFVGSCFWERRRRKRKNG